MAAEASARIHAFLVCIVAVCAALLIFLGNYVFLVSNSQYLSSLGAATATPHLAKPSITSDLAAKIFSDVTAYVKGSQPMLSHSSYFTQEELSHLADVRNKVEKSFYLFYLLAAASSVFAFSMVLRNSMGISIIRRALSAAGILTVALALFLALVSLSFGSAFVAFHKILFSSSQWLFPQHYLLVNLFTEEFFAAFARDVVVGSIIQGIALFIAAVVIGKFYDANVAGANRKPISYKPVKVKA
mgnify:FL=1